MDTVKLSKKKPSWYLLPLMLEVVLLLSLNIGLYIYRSSHAVPAEKVYLSGDLRMEVLSYTKELVPGHRAHLELRGRPYQMYRLDVIYYSGVSEASGLGWKSSDEDGTVRWDWKIGTRTYTGQVQAVVSNDEYSGYLDLFVVDEASREAEDGSFTDSVILLCNLAIGALVIPTVFCLKYDSAKRKLLLSGQSTDEVSSKLHVWAIIFASLAAVILCGVALVFVIVSVFGVSLIIPKPIRAICAYAVRAILIMLELSPLILMIIIIVLTIMSRRKRK